MSIYNLLEYRNNYSMTSRSLWNSYREEVNDSANENDDANDFRINNSFDKYYVPLVSIKDFNALIDNKPCFDQISQ